MLCLGKWLQTIFEIVPQDTAQDLTNVESIQQNLKEFFLRPHLVWMLDMDTKS